MDVGVLGEARVDAEALGVGAQPRQGALRRLPHRVPQAAGQGQPARAGHAAGLDDEHVNAGRRPAQSDRHARPPGTAGEFCVGRRRRGQHPDEGLRRDSSSPPAANSRTASRDSGRYPVCSTQMLIEVSGRSRSWLWTWPWTLTRPAGTTPERDVRHEEGALIGDHQGHRGLVAPCFRRRPGWAEVVVAEDEHLPGGQGAEPCEPRRVEGSRQGDVAPQMKRARWIDGRLPPAEQRAVPSRRRTRTAAGSSGRCCAPRGASHTRARSPRERSTRSVGRFDHRARQRASALVGGEGRGVRRRAGCPVKGGEQLAGE